MLRQPLRAAGIGQSGVQNGLHQWELGAAVGQVCPADHIADNEHVGPQSQLVGGIAFYQLNAQRAQLLTHGRVDSCVTASHLVTRFTCQRCQATHESSANAKDMNMHQQILG